LRTDAIAANQTTIAGLKVPIITLMVGEADLAEEGIA
jgi:acetyl-CoA carboxylase alpha subunit